MFSRMFSGAFQPFLVVASVMCLLLGGGTEAPAQSNDGGWTLNIDLDGGLAVPAGSEVQFKVDVGNSGNDARPATTIAFIIPKSTIFLGVDDFENCSPDLGGEVLSEDRTITCSVPEIPYNGQHEGVVRIKTTDDGTIELKGDMAAPGPSTAAKVTVEKGADLELELELASPSVQGGSYTEFSAYITNHGPHEAEGATLRIPVPAGLSADFSVLPAFCQIVDAEIACTIEGPLAPGEKIDLNFATQVTTGNQSTISIVGTVVGTTPRDGVSDNNNATVDLDVSPGTDISLTKTRSPQAELLVGQEVEFTLVPRFVGTLPLTAALTDQVPANYTVDAVSVAPGSGWSCEFEENAVSCEFDADEDMSGTNFAAPITISTTAIAPTEGTNGVTNTALISSENENEDMHGNNSANDGVAHIVPPFIDLVAHKSGPRDGLVVVDKEYEYRLRSHNDGNTGFDGLLTITDHLPAGLKVVAIAAPAGWTCPAVPAGGIEGGEGVDVVCTTSQYTSDSPLRSGQWTEDIVLTVEVTEDVEFANGMTVSFDDYQTEDIKPGNNTVYVGGKSTKKNDSADISVSKTVLSPANAKVAAGDELFFAIEIINAGPQPATNVILDDRLNDIVAAEQGGQPESVTPNIVEGAATGISCSAPASSGYSLDLQCSIANLPVCAQGKTCPVIKVPVRPGTQGNKTNTAIVFSLDVPDHDLSNNESSASYEVTARTDVVVEKTSIKQSPVGQPLVYTIAAKVPANGLSNAEKIVITDTLPDGLYFVSATANGVACTTVPDSSEPTSDGNNQVVCELGDIQNGSQRTAIITVIPAVSLVGETIRNEVSVKTDTPEVDADNNANFNDVLILPPELDLIISKEDRDGATLYDPVLKTEDTIYTITAENRGPSEAFNVVITDSLPSKGFADPRLVEPLPAGMTCEMTDTSTGTPGGQVVCRLERLGVNQPVAFQLRMKSVERGTHTNQVSITSDEVEAGYDIRPGNNKVSQTTTVRVKSDVGVTKVVSKPENKIVDLREEFSWTIIVTSNVGTGFEVAENVILEDTMPAGMVLTKAPVITAAHQHEASCDGVENGGSFRCNLGDMEPGQSFEITLYTKITDVDAVAKTNRARVSTDSFDQNDNNNEALDSVETVRGSTISGSVWADFNDNSSREKDDDQGIAGVRITLTGVATHDKAELTYTTTTADDGSYSFEGLPPGLYTVSYDNVPNPERFDAGLGQALPGSSEGTTVTAAGKNSIIGITTVAESHAQNHEFTLVPVPEIHLEKVAGTPVYDDANGYYVVPFTMTIENRSMEELSSIELTDDLAIAIGNFGTFTTSTSPREGEYSVAGTSTNTGSLKSGFNGAGSKSIVDSVTLVPDQKATVTVTLRVNPVKPWTENPLVLTNDAKVTGTGSLSGRDVSDEAAATVSLSPKREISLEKTAVLTKKGDIPAVDDRIDYSFKITNTGHTPLFDITLSDVLEDLQGLPDTVIARLDPGQSDELTFSAYYELTQDDLDNGTVRNEATVTGRWAEDGVTGPIVTDSDVAAIGDLAMPGLQITKEVDDESGIQDPTEPGDTIRYKITVENTGNTNLDNIVITDALTGVKAEVATPFEIGSLKPGGTAEVFANYQVTVADIDAGVVVNTAIANATSPDDTPVQSNEDETRTPLHQKPELEAVKTVTSTVPVAPMAGDEIVWTVTVENTGNVTLHDIEVTEPDFPAADISPKTIAKLEPGNSADFTVTATIPQSAIEAGKIANIATVNFNDPGGKPQDPLNPGTETDLSHVPGIELIKSTDLERLETPLQPGAEVVYNFIIRNTGNIALSTIELTDGLEGFVLDADDALMLAGLTLYPQGSSEGVSEVTVSGVYPLQAIDIHAASLTNTATVTAVPPSSPDTPVEDEDTTTSDLVRNPSIQLEKTVNETALSTPPVAGDILTYHFTITNNGNVTLDDIRLEELDDVVVSNLTGWTGPLIAGASNSDAFTATYELKQADIDNASFTNGAKVVGTSVGGNEPDDVFDIDEVTSKFAQVAGLAIEKSYQADLLEISQPDEKITYTFRVINTGNVTLYDVEVTDNLPDLDMPVTKITELLPGAENAVELTATYLVKQSDIERGYIDNVASVTGHYPDPDGGDPVTVPPVPSNEITVELKQSPDIMLIKEAVSHLSEPAFADEEIEYIFKVINTGNMTLTDIVIEDPMDGLEDNRFTVEVLNPGDQAQFTTTYKIVEQDIDNEQVLNWATATGSYGDDDAPSKTVEEKSRPDIEADEPEPTIVEVIPPDPGLTIIKTGRWDDEDGNSYPDAGEEIIYEFLVRNTGNAQLNNVTPVDAGPKFNGVDGTNQLSAFDDPPLTLMPGEEYLFTATYELSQADIDAAAGVIDAVTNTAFASGNLRNGRPYETTPVEALVTLPAAEPSLVTLTKQAILRQVRRGDHVPYIIKVENTSSSNVGPVDVTDLMPSGFRYVEDSAVIDTQPITPDVNGRNLVFRNLELARGTTAEIKLVLQALSTAAPGTHTNIASVTDRFGVKVTKDAHAVVEILAEPVFDCGEIIGTVFDDLNGNGYQDKGEPGLPGVRVATAKGWLITTDKHGRFHVPCAAMPDQRIGSNFIMKLDPRTLPTGYRLTTENPRVVRLTAGKMTKLNFGASLTRVIRLDLQEGAFDGNGVELQPQWQQGIDQLIEILKQEQSVLRLNYTGQGERELAARRIRSVRDHISRLWKKHGAAYQLEIETRIEAGL